MVQDGGPARLDGVHVVFDDQRAVSGAGIVLVATLAERLGIAALAARFVRLGQRVGAANSGPQGNDVRSGVAPVAGPRPRWPRST
jgi:hypothetical protein